MPEMRRDPLTGDWILYAPERAGRPSNYQAGRTPATGSVDPFAEGNEATTTEEVLAIREPGSEPNGPGWQARVILNKYPAVHQLSEDHDTSPVEECQTGFFESRPIYGQHDVIVESPRDLAQFHLLSTGQMAEVFGLYQARWNQLSADSAIEYAILFKNEGPAAGASLEHVHSQCLGLPFVPAGVKRVLAAAEAYRQEQGRNFFDDFLAEETKEQTRIVAETEHFVTVCPFFSRFPYETWIVPRQSGSRFENASAEEVAELAGQVHEVLNRLQRIQPGMPFNFILQSAPFRTDCDASYRWHLQITPRLSQLAGLELGSGQLVNLVLPESAAKAIKTA